MAKALRTLIAANWKMHGDMSWVFKPADFAAIYMAEDRAHLDVLICPPATLLGSMLDPEQTGVLLGGQDCHAEASGAHTGQPVWAIGTGKTATPDDVDEMHNVIREQVGAKTRLLYGGSVKPANAEALLALKNVNGALIGGAGLEMESLAEIAKAAPKA